MIHKKKEVFLVVETNWLNIVSVLGISGLVTSLNFLIQRHFNNKDKREEKRDMILQEIEEIREKMNEHDASLVLLQDKIEKSVDAQQALLRFSIIKIYNHYKPRKFFPIYARESFTSLYQSYQNICEDVVVDGLVKELMAFPTEIPFN